MARKSKGRGTAAAFGMLLLLAGLVGGGVLFALSIRRPTQAVEGFARAPVGCTTTLDFTETGVFFVFEDVGPPVEIPEGGCEPTADPSRSFAFEMSGPDGPVVPRADGSLSYDTGDYIGASVARIEVEVPGEYEIVVVGDDPSAAAAIGRDPDDGVEDLRQRAILVAIIGGVLGLLLLILAGRRSKKAAAFLTPDGPGWDLRDASKDTIPAPDISHLAQRPVNPHAPFEQVSIAPDLDEVDAMLAQAARPEPASPWAPPAVGDAAPTAAISALPDAADSPAEVVPEPASAVAAVAAEVVPEPEAEVAVVAEVVAEPPSDGAEAVDQSESAPQPETEQTRPSPDGAGTGSVWDTPPDEV